MAEASTSSSLRTDGRDKRRSEREYDRDSRRSRRRSRSPAQEEVVDEGGANAVLSRLGVPELTSADYYARATEFKAWLAESKHKYLDEISGQEARRYFDKFVRRWNDGRLAQGFYTGAVRASGGPSAGQTRHKWGFTKKAGYTAVEQQQLALVRDSVDTLTNSSTRGAIEARNAERKRPSIRNDADEEPPKAAATGSNIGARDTGWGPSSSSRPATDAALHAAAQRDHRQRARQDDRDMDETWNGKATGRDRLLEKKRERNNANREFANRRDADDGIEMDDRDLFGDDDHAVPPAARPRTAANETRARDNGISRREQRKAEMQEKISTLKDKEAQTMDMFKTLAQQRFGS